MQKLILYLRLIINSKLKTPARGTFMRLKLIVLFMFCAGFSASAQNLTYKGFPSLIWPTLYKITYAGGNPEDFQKPIFTEKVKGLAGKTVVLPGYIVPFASGMKSKSFMLSSLPLNACFFCGVGGPETVVEVETIDPVSYTDKPVEIQGTLRLNDNNPDRMIYILEKAEYVGPIEF